MCDESIKDVGDREKAEVANDIISKRAKIQRTRNCPKVSVVPSIMLLSKL